MSLDRQLLRDEIQALHRREHETLGERGTLERLECARRWDLAPVLRAGGVLVFPHTGVHDCGHQTTAVVQACLDSGADRVLIERAVVVSTADAFHHGIGYGDPPDRALHPEAGGLEAARRSIEEGIDILGRGDYWGYNQHCVRAKSDARDAGQVFRYLRGVTRGRIVELTYTDSSELYHAPRPTWVAGPLMEWQP
jgi:hypothetical protein